MLQIFRLYAIPKGDLLSVVMEMATLLRSHATREQLQGQINNGNISEIVRFAKCFRLMFMFVIVYFHLTFYLISSSAQTDQINGVTSSLAVLFTAN